MNPNPIAEDFGEGPARLWYGSGTEPNVEVNIWRLDNTLVSCQYSNFG
jgi:hypothetical protein